MRTFDEFASSKFGQRLAGAMRAPAMDGKAHIPDSHKRRLLRTQAARDRNALLIGAPYNTASGTLSRRSTELLDVYAQECDPRKHLAYVASRGAYSRWAPSVSPSYLYFYLRLYSFIYDI